MEIALVLLAFNAFQCWFWIGFEWSNFFLPQEHAGRIGQGRLRGLQLRHLNVLCSTWKPPRMLNSLRWIERKVTGVVDLFGRNLDALMPLPNTE